MFDPDNFWNHALQLLSQQEVDECSARIAAGRAYYAFLLTVVNRLQNQGVIFGKGAGIHGKAIGELRRRNRRPMAEDLRRLCREREEADYDLELEINGDKVMWAMQSAENSYANAKTL